jgi:hypothetical protein
MTPPKCRTCGEIEWQHVCGLTQQGLTRQMAATILKAKDKIFVGRSAIVTKPQAIVTATKAPGGRPKVHASAADRQRACRSRKAQSHVKA